MTSTAAARLREILGRPGLIVARFRGDALTAVIADAGTGCGDAVSMWRTVRGYERAGAATIHIEDQVWPRNAASSSASR